VTTWTKLQAVVVYVALAQACSDSPSLERDAAVQLELDDGQACTLDASCKSNHCGNGFCCASGDCCASASDCPASYSSPPECDQLADCQGTAATARCESSTCSTQQADDDSACTGVASDCGPYAAVSCSGEANQTAPVCATTCDDDNDCDATAYCNSSSVCVPDEASGQACTMQSQCGAGLTCVDNVCCTSACANSCMRCDVAGSIGTCAPVPDGTDPSQECGAVSCTNYFAGFAGDSCRRKADVTAAQAMCNGAGACRTQADECTAQTLDGTTQITCNALCQDPTAATCVGTTPGACTNVSQGNQTCGNGACAVTVPVCTSGAPNTCTPNSGAATAEVCNNADDNCDGSVDNGNFADAFEPNASCGAVAGLPLVSSDETKTFNALTLYGSGDADYFQINALETDTICGCGSFSFDEDYRLDVSLSVPADAGAYELCLNTACSFSGSTCLSVAAGNTATLGFYFDGTCAAGPADSYTVFVRVGAGTSPGFECSPYTLSYAFDAGLCR
jgi:hypothetical protein